MGARILLLAFFILLSGCTSITYRYVPPKDDSDKQCVMRCEELKAVCERKNEALYLDCLEIREVEEREYQHCQNTKGSCIKPDNMCKNDGSYQYGLCMKEYEEDMRRYNICNQKKCKYPRYCYKSDQMHCLSDYHRCFEICGGQVIRIEQ